jgi:hypothetical protein
MPTRLKKGREDFMKTSKYSVLAAGVVLLFASATQTMAGSGMNHRAVAADSPYRNKVVATKQTAASAKTDVKLASANKDANGVVHVSQSVRR